MRSMLQLLGGVAVAGVVAAGATAFTASGVTLDSGTVTADKLFLGGGMQVTATGTVVDGVTYGFADASTKLQLNKITLSFADTNAEGGGVTLVTAGTGAAQPTWTCGAVSSSASVCNASAPFALSPPANTVTTITVAVTPA